MIVEEAPIYKNQQFTKNKYVYNSSNILNKNDKENLNFYKDNIRTIYTMEVFYNSYKRIKFFNFRENNVSFVSSRSNLDLNSNVN
jgi:ribosomal protein S4E